MTRIAGPLYWERTGDTGTPFALLHPLPTDRRSWLYQSAHFSTWFRTIAIDFPGYGRSPRASSGLTVEELADACWDAIDRTSTGPAIIAGVSMGSHVAQYMAASRPDRTLAIVLTAGGWYPASDARFYAAIQDAVDRFTEHGLAIRASQIDRGFGPDFAGTPLARYLAELFTDEDPTSDAATIAETYRSLLTPMPDDLHARIKAPTLVVTGSADAGHPQHKVLASRIRGAEVRVMEGAGHCVMLERPWDYDAHVLGFLGRKGLL